MAPSPVLNIEPKGPDKNDEKCIESVSTKDKQNMSKAVDINAASKEKISVDQSFADIEEAGLKSLLDEAYSYKSPKDRLGKSNLFQVLLNEVEANDTGKKKLSERSNSFADGRGNCSSGIGNGHDTSTDKAFLNILGGCEKEKKKKKNKRDGSNANSGSRRPKFSHSLKINHGPQSSSHIYNGNGNAHYNGGSRSLSRAQQSFNARINNTKTAALLTSSSNIDIPMVTTSNKQPIMTPALVPSTPKNAQTGRKNEREYADGRGVDDSIEMKIIETKSNVYNYTTHASLEIGVDTDGNDLETGFPSQSNGNALTNGNADRSPVLQHSAEKSSNDEKDDMDSVVGTNAENEEDKQSKKKNKKKQAFSSDNNNDSCNRTSLYATSLDEPKTMTSLLQKSAQNSSTNNSAYKFPTETSYSCSWPYPNVILTLTGESMASFGRSTCTKESLETRRLYDENTNALNSGYSYLNSGSGSMSRERLDNVSERKHKIRKPKKQNTTSVLSENIEGYCGDKSVEYLLDYIENTKTGGENGAVKIKHKTTPARVGDRSKNKASTDDDVRSKKPNKAKERLKKSTSLEDLRRDKSKQTNKKQSSVDDSHYAKDADVGTEPACESKSVYDSSNFYDSVDHADDDNYTETEFHLVTKKQRKKKRRSKSRTCERKHVNEQSLQQNFLPHNYTDKNDNVNFAYQNKRSTRGAENRHRSRRKSVSSVVPSDKISDTDSIHSLPVSSTTPKCKIKKKSTSSGCTPQASYADIAKSPQCNSSTTLGDTAKWHLKTFSNSPSAYSTQNTNSFCSSASSSNTGDTPDHSDHSELVSVAKYGNVASDESCDSFIAYDVNVTDANDSGVAECEVTLKRNVKCNRNDNDTNNNTRNGIDKTPKDYHANVNLCNHSNTNVKIKKTRNKKNKNIDDDTNDNHDANGGDGGNDENVKNCNDLSVEFTLKCVPYAATKSDDTLVEPHTEMNNNVCQRYSRTDVTVEETVVLKTKNTSEGWTQDKLSHSLPINETGQAVLLLDDCSAGEINVAFDVNEQSLEAASVTKERQIEMQKQIFERSSKYNVTEVIQYVNKGWSEVFNTLKSAKVASTKKVRYYVAK